MEREECSYLNPPPLSPDEIEQIYGPNPEADAREKEFATAAIHSIRKPQGTTMNSLEVWECDLGHGTHPVVVVSHPARAQRKDIVEVLDCSTQRGAPPAFPMR
jgi:hypothetical protein